MKLELTEEQTAELFAVLGLPEDTTDPFTVVAAIADLAAVENVAVAAKAGKGLQVVASDHLAALEAAAEEGRAVAAAAARARVETVVTDAIREGKLPPARRDHWITMIEADETMADVLASAPTVVPLVELGHSHGADADIDAETPEWFR